MDWTATNTSSLLLYQAGDSDGYIPVAWLHLEFQSSKSKSELPFEEEACKTTNHDDHS